MSEPWGPAGRWGTHCLPDNYNDINTTGSTLHHSTVDTFQKHASNSARA